ncbi:MAG TPA: Gmad2 immunoglobulin-like domain-containing protein [Patescibacteria group bacterium]|nr:Gmad2 immunoglobulin-like domain-containing protein [Patescibacteria group bacterium]
MNHSNRPLPLVAIGLALATFVAACTGASGPLGTLPAGSSGPEPSVVQGSPDATPASSGEPTGSEPTGSEPPTSDPSTEPSGGPIGTTIVRAYLWLGGVPGSEGLVAVLREVPATKSVATAAITSLFAGPTGAETSRSISTAIPDGSRLLGISITNGVATIDLSSEFESGGGSASVQGRLGQVVYTLTQFPSIKSVVFQIEGKSAEIFSGEGIVLDKPVGRADYVALLPDIWVDRPAFNAAIGNPAHVTGNADVFEATFKIAILDGAGNVLVDQMVMATCGTGCRGTFDVTIPYTVTKAQYGTLRVYFGSARDGSPQSIRDYRVWLTPKS